MNAICPQRTAKLRASWQKGDLVHVRDLGRIADGRLKEGVAISNISDVIHGRPRLQSLLASTLMRFYSRSTPTAVHCNTM